VRKAIASPGGSIGFASGSCGYVVDESGVFQGVDCGNEMMDVSQANGLFAFLDGEGRSTSSTTTACGRGWMSGRSTPRPWPS